MEKLAEIQTSRDELRVTFDLYNDESCSKWRRRWPLASRRWCVSWQTTAGVTFVTATVADATFMRMEFIKCIKAHKHGSASHTTEYEST